MSIVRISRNAVCGMLTARFLPSKFTFKCLYLTKGVGRCKFEDTLEFFKDSSKALNSEDSR